MSLGVCPSLVQMFASAPRSSRVRTTLPWPRPAANANDWNQNQSLLIISLLTINARLMLHNWKLVISGIIWVKFRIAGLTYRPASHFLFVNLCTVLKQLLTDSHPPLPCRIHQRRHAIPGETSTIIIACSTGWIIRFLIKINISMKKVKWNVSTAVSHGMLQSCWSLCESCVPA